LEVGVWGWCLGFRVWGLGYGVLGMGFEVWGLGFGSWGLELRFWGLGSTRAVQGPWVFSGGLNLVEGFWLRVSGFGPRASGFGSGGLNLARVSRFERGQNLPLRA